MITFFTIIQFLVSVALILLVVVQSSKGEGLGAIGGSSQLFSIKNRGFEALMDKMTTIVASVFLLVCVILTILHG